jgi:hypothetical protein
MTPKQRKHHYFRGFIVASLLWSIGTIIFMEVLLSKLS